MSFMNAAALFVGGQAFLPRFRHIGDLTLDLFHHDGRVEDRWLALDHHEFDLLWQLAGAPRRCLPEQALAGVTQDTEGLAITTARLRAKLRAHGLADFLIRHPKGYYYLDAISYEGFTV